MRKRAIIFAGVASLLAVGFVIVIVVYFAQPWIKPSQLRVGIVTWPGLGPCFVAREKGFFGKLDVQCRIIDDTRAKRAAYTAGELDMFSTTVDTYAIEAATGVRGKIIFASDESHGGDAIVVRKGINSIADLKGKKVVFAAATPSHFFLLYLLQQNGLRLKDIQPTVVDDPSLAGQAFIAGQVDAAVTWEPFVSQAAATPHGKVLVSSKEAQDLIIAAFVVHDQVLNQRYRDIKQFTEGWFKAIEYVRADPDGSLDIISRGLNIPKGDIASMMQGLRLIDKNVNAQLFGLTGVAPARIEAIFTRAGELWKSVGLITDPVPFSRVIDKEIIKNLLEK